MSGAPEPTIAVAAGAGPDRLLAYGGRPAWPAPTSLEVSAIERAAALVGRRIALVEAEPADEPDGQDLVIGVGGAAAVARLYAHLTGRRVDYADDVASGVRSDPALVVALERDLPVAALDELAERGAGGQVIGVITGHDPQSLLLQALTRSTASRASATAPTSRVAVFPTHSGPCPAGDDVVLDATATAGEIRRALGSGAGVLTIMAHSDGVDANLGRLVLCPMDRTPDEADPRRLPHCRRVGTCHRASGMAIEQWVDDPRRVAPEMLAARVLLYATCWGVLPPVSFDDNAWSIGRRLLNNPRLGALVTSWEVHSYRADDLLRFARNMTAGVALGDAVAQLLATPHARQNGLRLFLLGDPGLRLGPATATGPATVTPTPAPAPALVTPTPAPAPAPCFDARTAGELAMLRLYVHAIAPQLSEPSRAELALASIARYELAGARGLLGARAPAVAGWRDSVLDAMVWRGPLAAHNWLSLVGDTRTRSVTTTCHHCEQRVTTRDYTMRWPNAASRTVHVCTHCGVIGDAAAPRSIAIRVTNGFVHLVTDVGRGPWAARLAVYGKGERGPRASVEWPAAADGWPERSSPIPTGAVHGTAEVAVFLLHDVSWYIARVPVRS